MLCSTLAFDRLYVFYLIHILTSIACCLQVNLPSWVSQLHTGKGNMRKTLRVPVLLYHVSLRWITLALLLQVNFPDFERVGWLNSVVGKDL